MDLRHLICIIKNNKYKVFKYGQWDNSPEIQGTDILLFLRNEMNRDTFSDNVSLLTFINQDELKKIFEDELESNILDLIQNFEKSLNFKNSSFIKSSFCEWVYIIDLDKNTFEVKFPIKFNSTK